MLVNAQPSHKRCTYEDFTKFDNDDIFRKPSTNDLGDPLLDESEQLDNLDKLQ